MMWTLYINGREEAKFGSFDTVNKFLSYLSKMDDRFFKDIMDDNVKNPGVEIRYSND